MTEAMSFSVALLAASTVCLLLAFLTKRQRYRLPPGPRGLPILGNIFNAPQEHEWRTFQEWGRKYDSDVLYFEIMGTRYVVLNSAKATADLFERRSNLYSDRHPMPMLELTGFNRNWAFLKYDGLWRMHRKIFHQYFRSNAVYVFHQRSTESVRQLLRSLYATQERFPEHIQFMTAYNIIGLMYGINVKPEGDLIMALVEGASDVVQKVGNPGVYLVDSFPILKYIPSWFPGAKFKRDAESWKPKVDKMYLQPYNDVKAAYENGNPRPCLATNMLATLDEAEAGSGKTALEDAIISVNGSAYVAGSDTSTATLLSFVLAMMLYPEAQRAAQEELDCIVGIDRLPEMEDEQSLPFVTALVKETMRWRPVVPLGLAHRLVADDEYCGYHIPSGSVVIGNVRAILHDEEQFPNPDKFNPGRFLDSEGQLRKHLADSVSSAFGFGRRICPGRYFAMDVIWLAIANILSAFTIEKPVDESGNIVEPSSEYLSGVVSHPVPFKAVFKPRSTIAFS